jgi:integral membrane protein (TIGR01906 family)
MKSLNRFVFWMIAILVPVILVLLSVRLLLSPLYIHVEYRMPGFPKDTYGFSFEERLYWANISRLYLLNDEDIDFLGEKQLDDNTPLYNQRELRHMYDVKVVVRAAMWVMLGGIVFEIVVGYWSIRTNLWVNYMNALSMGGWLSVGLIAAIMVYLLFNFNSLFTNFHLIFFEGDSWLFRYSDTLIRLFPLEFWRDAFIWVGALTLVVGGILGYFLPRWKPGTD